MGPSYEALRERYAKELRNAKEAVDDWWSTLVALTIAQLGSREAAEKALRRRWPIGPAAHPRILGVVRTYYLFCDELNRASRLEQLRLSDHGTSFALATGRPSSEVESDLPLSPGVMIEESLYRADSYDLAKIVSRLTYWPIGVDEQGNFV